MTTDETIENESADYQLGYDAGYEAGKEALKKEVEESNREIGQIYGLESYSMLSEKEVRKLIEYEKSLYKSSEKINAGKQASIRMAESMEETLQAIAKDSATVLESVLANTPDYKGVTPTAVTDFLTNNNEV